MAGWILQYVYGFGFDFYGLGFALLANEVIVEQDS